MQLRSRVFAKGMLVGGKVIRVLVDILSSWRVVFSVALGRPTSSAVFGRRQAPAEFADVDGSAPTRFHLRTQSGLQSSIQPEDNGPGGNDGAGGGAEGGFAGAESFRITCSTTFSRNPAGSSGSSGLP